MFASSEVGNLQIKLIDLGLSRELGGSNKVCTKFIRFVRFVIGDTKKMLIRFFSIFSFRFSIWCSERANLFILNLFLSFFR